MFLSDFINESEFLPWEISLSKILESSIHPFLTKSSNLHLLSYLKKSVRNITLFLKMSLWRWLKENSRKIDQKKKWKERNRVNTEIGWNFLYEYEIWTEESAVLAPFLWARGSQDGGRSPCRSPKWGAGEFAWRGSSLLGALMAPMLLSYRELGTQRKY